MVDIIGTKQKEETLGLIAKGWQTTLVGETITITQKNDLGGKSLEKLILSHFPSASSESRDKSRIIHLTKTDKTPPIIEEWMEHTKIRLVEETGFYSMPGLFGWNKIDKGSQILTETLPSLKGRIADFGCGYGYLSRHILANNPELAELYCLDIDIRAVEACEKNVNDVRAHIRQADCTQPIPDLPPIDFIVSNPPFHNTSTEDRTMGQRFIETAYHHLKKGGQLWIVANIHMPYEKILESLFREWQCVKVENGFKILRALK